MSAANSTTSFSYDISLDVATLVLKLDWKRQGDYFGIMHDAAREE
jgi:hypothetical protein